MKKFTLLIAALLLVSFGAFGQEVDISAEVSGDASATFGFDLNNSTFGITNDASAELDITFISEETLTNSEDGVTGYIELTFEAVADTAGIALSASVDEAQVQFGPMVTLNIMGISKAVDYANLGQGIFPIFLLDMPKLNETTSVSNAVTGDKGEDGADDYGYELVLDLGAAAINFGFGTPQKEGDNTGNDFSLFAGVSLTAVENLTLDVGFNYETDTTDPSWGLGVEAGYDLGIVPLLVGFDFVEGGDWELGAGFALVLGEDMVVSPWEDDGEEYYTGLTVGFAVDQDSDIDLGAAFAYSVSMIDMVALFEMADMTDLGIGVDVSADLGVAMPYATFKYTDIASADTIGLTVGVELSVIPLTTFTLQYETADIENNNGVITFETAVAF